MSVGKASFEQYWLILAATALLVAALVVLSLAIKPCDPSFNPNYSYQCYEEGITGFLAVWWMALMVLGPIPVLRYQFRKVRRGECFVVTGVFLSVAGSVVSNVVGFLFTMIAVALGQRSHTLNMYSGDASFALLGLFALAILSVCLTAIIAAAVLWHARPMRPNSTVETDARKSGVRSSP